MSINSDQIDAHCARLAKYPAPRGWSTDQLLEGYSESLKDYRADVVGRVVERFVTGGIDPKVLSPNWAPTPPALAVVVKAADAAAPASGNGQGYAYSKPNSEVLEVGIEREDARNLVRADIYPRGSIWCPGDPEAPQYGILYGQDPNWKGPQRLPTGDEIKRRKEDEAREAWKARTNRTPSTRMRSVPNAAPHYETGYSSAARVHAETAGRKAAREGEQ